MNTPSPNEVNAVNAILTDDDIRGWLLDNKGAEVVAKLEGTYGVTFTDRDTAIKRINKHDWNDVRVMEKLLLAAGNDGVVHPLSA